MEYMWIVIVWRKFRPGFDNMSEVVGLSACRPRRRSNSKKKRLRMKLMML